MEIANGIYTSPEFLTPAECDDWIALSERVGFEAATLATMGGSELQKDIRNNDRVILDDHDRAFELWLKLEPAVPCILEGRQAVGLNERLRFYRYDPGQQFRGHVDAPYRRENGQSSMLTFLVYLNDGYEGGETKFDDAVVTPAKGMALLFRHELFHEGSALIKGRKYVLRSDVMYNPPGRYSG
jgi:hypothetical protein